MALYELRTYTLYVGKMAEAAKLFNLRQQRSQRSVDQHVIPTATTGRQCGCPGLSAECRFQSPRNRPATKPADKTAILCNGDALSDRCSLNLRI